MKEKIAPFDARSRRSGINADVNTIAIEISAARYSVSVL